MVHPMAGTKDTEKLHSSVEIVTNTPLSERKVRESRQWLLTKLNSIGDGVIATDTKGCVKFMNPVAEMLTGWKQADAMGMPVDMVFHIINEHSRRIVENPVTKVLSTGQVARLADHTVLISRNNLEIPIKDSSAPIIIDEGELTGVVLVFQDDTRARLAEKKIRDSNARLQLAMESADEGLWEMDTVTLKMHFDDFCFAMLGFESTVAGNDHRRWWLTRIHQDDRPAVQKALHDIVSRPEEPLNIDFRLACKDGVYLWVNSRAKVIANSTTGDNQLVVGIQRDISKRITAQEEKKQLEIQLFQAQKMEAIGTLAGGIAHDFNNILTAVIGYAELSISETEKDSTLHNNLNEILVAGSRAKDLVRQILMFSRNTELDLRPIRLNSLIKETTKLMRATLPSYVNINYEITEEFVTIKANPTQIHQILINLCTNGYHSLDGTDGVLTLQLDIVRLDNTTTIQHTENAPGGYARIAVKDNGQGIDPENMEKIFDPYFTTKEQGKGTGLGLSIVHAIVDSHNGYITVESLLGVGTTFSVYLPLRCSDASAATETRFKDLLRGSERILIVADKTAIEGMQSQRLQQLGYSVKVVPSAMEALAHFDASPRQYDLVITDMAMPAMSGAELTRRIKAIRPDIRVILCADYSEKIDSRKISKQGFDGCLLKPVGDENMALMIRKIVDGLVTEREAR